MTTFLIILTVYLIGAVVTYGFARADWDDFGFKLKRRFPSVTDDITERTARPVCIVFAVIWPFAIIPVLGQTENGIRHLKWRLISKLPSNKEQ